MLPRTATDANLVHRASTDESREGRVMGFASQLKTLVRALSSTWSDASSTVRRRTRKTRNGFLRKDRAGSHVWLSASMRIDPPFFWPPLLRSQSAHPAG